MQLFGLLLTVRFEGDVRFHVSISRLAVVLATYSYHLWLSPTLLVEYALLHHTSQNAQIAKVF